MITSQSTPIEAVRHTLGDLIHRYTKEVLPRLSKGTAYNRTLHLRWWGTTIGHVCLADVSSGTLTECREQLAHTRSAGTTNQYLSTLAHVFSVAVREWAWLDDSPMKKVRKLRQTAPRTRYLSEDERQRLLVACQASTNRMLYMIVELALNTGARRMELLSLHWGDVDLRRRELTFRMTKNRRVRVLPLAQHVFDLLLDHSKVRRMDTKLVFANRDGRQPVAIRTAWEKALKAAKVADFRFHDLRHSFASYTAMSGASLIDLQTLLGHSSPSMTSRYAHLAQPHLAHVVERMGASVMSSTPSW